MVQVPEDKIYDPVGRCIYCGSLENPELLTREHIVPYGLNGKLILPKSSCVSCSKITSGIETFCLQHMFIDARTHLNLPSRSHRRNKKPRPSLKMGHIGPDNEVIRWEQLGSADYPFALVTMEFPPAGIFCRRPSSAPLNVNMCFVPSKSFAARMSKLPTKAALYYKIDSDPLARMLAKIAHSLAVASFGLGSFTPFLADAILGKRDNVFHYVGGAVSAETSKANTLHLLRLSRQNGLITAYVRLFSYMETPAYLIAVGRYS